MQTQNYTIVVGVVITIIVLLLATSFIFILVAFSNNRKKHFFLEKQHMQQHFNEQLLQSQLEMQEQTFDSISKEIHDNVGQVLSLAKVQLNIMAQSEITNPELLTDLKENIGKAMVDLRDIAKSLNSDRIKLSSLVEMANHELQRIGRLGIIKVFLFTEGVEENVGEQKKQILLRIIQECLQNILKHAKAEKIEVFFYFYYANFFKCQIKDDGIGFDTGLINKKDGLGLQNIINRAALLGGQAYINSAINHGTTITIILPYA